MSKASNRKNPNELPIETADQLLQNVFDTCGYERNNVPLDALMSYSNYRQERYTLQKLGITIALALFILLPFLFISANIYVAIRNEGTESNPTYQVSVDSSIPIKQIVATIDGRTVPITEVGSHEFTIQPGTNGDMSIFVTLINEQETSTAVSVVEVDSTPPILLSTDIHTDSISLRVMDEESGVDFDRVVVTDDEGGEWGFFCDAEKGCIVVSYPSRAVKVSVPDKRGNVLTLRLNPQTVQ